MLPKKYEDMGLFEIGGTEDPEVFAISESCGYTYQDIPESKLLQENLVEKLHLNETKVTDSKGGVHVLGVLSGPAFVPDGYSRNKRFYPKELWENAMTNKSLQTKLEHGMFGTILHPTSESQAHPIRASHIVKDLWIDKTDGLGKFKAYILNTPNGNVLNTIFRAKDENGKPLVKPFVSTRAFGKYLEGKEQKGCKIMDPNNFILESVDAVFDPGFLEACPSLQESLLESNKRAINLLESWGKDEDSEGDAIYLSEEEAKTFVPDIPPEDCPIPTRDREYSMGERRVTTDSIDIEDITVLDDYKPQSKLLQELLSKSK